MVMFGVATVIIRHKPGQGLQPLDAKLLFEAVILIVFLGMNVLYVLFWKRNAAGDYFASQGDPPPPAGPEFGDDLKR